MAARDAVPAVHGQRVADDLPAPDMAPDNPDPPPPAPRYEHMATGG
jgi:hypothetical protein